MDRRTFLHHGCLACAAMMTPALLTSCASAAPLMGSLEGDDLVLAPGAFTGPDGSMKSSVVVGHKSLKQPIVVFRDADGGYHALLMRCTHRGAELRLTGDRLDCPAHGSAFDAHGAVLEGPASTPLHSYPVREQDGRLRVSLKA